MIDLGLKSLWNRRFSVGLTVLSIAMSIALILGVERIRTEAREGFANSAAGIDMIVAPRGNDVQILLATVFGVGSTGAGIGWDVYEMIEGLEPVDWAVPVMMGDNHRGFPVIGTTPAYFDMGGRAGRAPLAFSSGKVFDKPNEAVVGAEIAARFGYAPGTVIVNAHGAGAVAFDVHDEAPFVVSGVLAETGTAADRLVIVSIEGFDLLHEDDEDAHSDPLNTIDEKSHDSGEAHADHGEEAHDDHGEEAHDEGDGHDGHDDHSEDVHDDHGNEAHDDDHDGHAHLHEPDKINAIYVGLKSKTAILSIQRMIADHKDEPLSAVLPNVALLALWSITGTAETALQVMAIAVALAGIIGMVVMLMASLDARRREFAIFRSVGATPMWVCGQIVTEACLVTFAGLVLGVALLAGVSLVADPILTAQYGFGLGSMFPAGHEWVLLGGIFCFGAVAGLIPAWRVYRITLADGLAVKL